MLIEFSVENYLSFKDKVTLSMVASADKHLQNNTIQSEAESKINLLKSTAIYGQNASGKSNLVNAIGFMRYFVIYSANGNKNSPISVTPFKLDQKAESQPSNFEMIFLVYDDKAKQNIRYQYGFSADSKAVYEEWLYSYPKKQRKMLFERSPNLKNVDNSSGIKLGHSWKGNNNLIIRTRENALFLSVAAQFNDEEAATILDWFFRKLVVLTSNMLFIQAAYFPGENLEKEKFREPVKRFLTQADFGIKDYAVEKRPAREINIPELLRFGHIPDDAKGSLAEIFKPMLEKFPKEDTINKLIMLHSGVDVNGKSIEVGLRQEEESEGTMAAVALYVNLLQASTNQYTFIVDEFGVRFHPLLSKWLIESFNRSEKSHQFILTTHDSTLLDKELFRRDQIWFTEKNHKTGATDLYSLWEFKPGKVRKDENFMKGYLMGRYGAIPFVGDILDI